MKKGLLLLLALAVMLAFTASAADAKPRSGMKSPRQSFTQTPSKKTDSVQQSNTGTKSGAAAAGTTTTAKRGFFSGGGFMKGLMIGGLAGMLFGGLFGGMGFFGNFLGLLVNLLAIYALFIIVRAIALYFYNRRKPANPYDRR